ncbi:MAG TPA: BlaI/MecI/CopY family transcriptional regulator, partial [Verrucomicrobiae bacterium]|nr:BlaI/MecI/CopY family transcriptional regulator [Verrucomicrobiae bacterium]
EDGARYVYWPCVSREAASRSALKRILTTFFRGSVDHAVAALLDASDKKLSEADLERLRDIINQAGKEGKK